MGLAGKYAQIGWLALAKHQHWHVPDIEYVLWAIVFGLIITNTVGLHRIFRPGVGTYEFWLKVGIVLLGARFVLGDVLKLGATSLVQILIDMTVAGAIILAAARWFGAKARAIEAMSLYGVATLFLQTSNYRRAEDVVRPELVARFIAAAHDRGINVVGWYLPSLANPVRDLRRALRAAQFRTVDGDGFDSFALDIEARVIRSPWRRTVSLLRLSTSIRRALGPSYALGAIVPSGRRMRLDPGYWPGFPYKALARSFDVFLPMTYFAYGPKGARSRADTIEDVGLMRTRTKDPAIPIHIIGGLASLARTSEVNAFASTASGCGALGMSLYDFAGTIADQWAALAHVTGSASSLARSCR